MESRKEAEQQYARRQQEKFDRLAEYSLDKENQKKYAAKREEWKKIHSGKIRIDEEKKPVVDAEGWLYNEGISVDISGSGQHLEIAKRNLEKLEELLKEYDSTAVSYNVIADGSLAEGGSAYMMNGKTSIQVAARSFKRNAAIDGLRLGDNQIYGITYHEFAHSLSQSREKMNPEFWKEIRKIRKEYNSKRGSEEWFNVKISDYADKDIDEFFAEAFTQAKLSERPSEYAERVLAATDKYFKKSIVKHAASDIMESGARITNLFSKEADEFAEMYYKEIRSFSTDTRKIAENLGKQEADIRKVKAYLFEEKSLFDPETGQWRRFDPDCAIAQSWQRLMIGKDIKQHDRVLIEHELLEMEIKQKRKGISHKEAHELAAKKYDYGKEALEYYGDLKKHNKNRE